VRSPMECSQTITRPSTTANRSPAVTVLNYRQIKFRITAAHVSSSQAYSYPVLSMHRPQSLSVTDRSTQQARRLQPGSPGPSTRSLDSLPALNLSSPSASFTNPRRFGPFTGATNVNASHSTFTDIAGDLNIRVVMQVCLN
jgi:hypothetical protein